MVFAYDKVNYARYLPVYYAQMTNLQAEHPEVHNSFMEGQFSVQLLERSPFGRIPVDLTTEVTVNKDTKTIGGVTKFSLKGSAVNRYYLTAEYRSSFLSQVRNMVQIKQSQSDHKEMLSPRISRDEKAVSAVESLIDNWNNPFQDSQELICVSTAKTAPVEVANDMLKARHIGKKKYQEFNEQRLESSPPQIKFHDPIKLQKLKTFTSLIKKKTVKIQGRTIMLKADRSLFGRMIICGQSRNIEILH